MDETKGSDLDPVREAALRRKLGKWAEWRRPEVVPSIGPFDPSPFEAFEARLDRLVGDCRSFLASLQDEDVPLLARNDSDVARSWDRQFLKRLQDLDRKLPPWYAAGFGHPDHAADFEYWCKMQTFSLAEATSLSIGVEPRHLAAELKDMRVARERGETPSAPLQFLALRYEQLSRRFDPQSHGWRVRPKEFLEWAVQLEFEAHPAFLTLLRKYHGKDETTTSSPSAPRKTDPREIDKIAQLFTAMAVEWYGYEPRQSRSPIPKEITDLAASMGLEISDDTVRKYLKLGAKFIPPDWKPNSG